MFPFWTTADKPDDALCAHVRDQHERPGFQSLQHFPPEGFALWVGECGEGILGDDAGIGRAPCVHMYDGNRASVLEMGLSDQQQRTTPL